MKKLLLLFIGCLTASISSAQFTQYTESESFSAISVGFLNGGGGLVGLDLEIMMNDRLGIQFGAGLVSYGAALNFHLKPGIRTSFLSIQYLNQGTGDSFTQNAIDPASVIGAKDGSPTSWASPKPYRKARHGLPKCHIHPSC